MKYGSRVCNQSRVYIEAGVRRHQTAGLTPIQGGLPLEEYLRIQHSPFPKKNMRFPEVRDTSAAYKLGTHCTDAHKGAINPECRACSDLLKKKFEEAK